MQGAPWPSAYTNPASSVGKPEICFAFSDSLASRASGRRRAGARPRQRAGTRTHHRASSGLRGRSHGAEDAGRKASPRYARSPAASTISQFHSAACDSEQKIDDSDQ
jgi:hypothetical protein